MSQYYVDPALFSASDWTVRTGDPADAIIDTVADGGDGDPAILVDWIGNADDVSISYDPAGKSTDVELLTISRTAKSGGNRAGLAGRISAPNFYETIKFQNSIYIGRMGDERSFLANTGTASKSVFAYERFQISGNTIRVRRWIGGLADEPGTWDLEVTDSVITESGYAGVAFRNPGPDYYKFIGIGTNGDPAPTGPVSGGETGLLASEATSSDTWAVTCQSAATLSAAAIASDSFNTIAQVNTSIIAAAQATDSSGDQPAALGTLSQSATGNDTLDALANAAAALSAGAAAGESWTVQAQVFVNLLEQGVAADQIQRQAEDAINAALAEQSAASDQFVASINAIAALTDTSTASDAYLAVVAQLGSIASGAIASDSFRTSFGLLRTLQSSAAASDTFSINFGYQSALQSGALSSDAWLLMVSMSAALSEICTAEDLLQAKASVTTRVTAGAIAMARFAIVNAGIQYLVMGSIILRDALNYRVTHKPALNQSVKIKPGH